MDIEAILEMYEDDYNPSSMVPGPRNMAYGGRIPFSKGLDVKIPKYPDLRMFPPVPNEAQAKAKTKVINKFKKDLKKYILKEIKEFQKTALPKEKYQLIENEIHRAMGYDQAAGKKPSKTVVKYVKEVIEELPKDGTWEANKTGKGQLSSSVDRSNPIPENIKNKTKDFFRKNYKNLNISQMAERLTNTISGNPLHAAVKENLNRYKNFLIEKNVIKDTDLSKGVGGAEGIKKLPPKAYADYRKEYTDLATKAGITDDPQFFATKGKSKGKFGYWKFDDYMKNTMLNMDKIRATLSPDFPTMLLPSFEHTMGVKPGLITGDTSALKKVELQTKKYNFGAIDGMGARSADFRRVQANLKSATKELKAGNLDAANTSLAKVNEIYDNVAEKFNINRKGLPNYNIDGKNIFENNIKEVSKAEKPNKSMFNFFEKVANQASKKEMKVIKKSDPQVFDVLTEFQGEGDSKKIREMIKVIGCPNAKAGGGRIEFQDGLTCFDKGQKLINSGMKDASQASMRNFSKFANSALKLGRNVMRFGVIPEAMFIGAESLVRMGMGDTLSEASKQAVGFYLDPIFGTNFKKEGAFSKMAGDVGAEMAFDVSRLNEYNEALSKIEKLKSAKEQTLAVNDESLTGQTDLEVMEQYDKFIADAQTELNKRMLTETERVDFENKADTAKDVAGVNSPIRQFLGKARSNTQLMRVEDDFSGMQSDMMAPEVTQKDLNKNMLPQKAMTPRLSKFVNFDDRQLEQLSGLTKKPVKELRDYQDYLNKERALSFADQERIFGKEQTYGTQGNFFGEQLNKKPVYDYAEGGITALRSKYEYKK